MKTLEDAIAALDRLEPQRGSAEFDNLKTVSAFLNMLRAKLESCGAITDAQGFIIEAAMQSGFDILDDDADLLAVSCRKLVEFVERMQAEPVDLILHCPECGFQHIDEPGRHTRWANVEHPPATDGKPWDNPPHRSHLCHQCGYIWRPADVPTNGVAAIKTKGQHDSPAPGVYASKAEPA